MSEILQLSDITITGMDIDGNQVVINVGTPNTTMDNTTMDNTTMSNSDFFNLSVTNEGIHISHSSEGSLHLSDLDVSEQNSLNTTNEDISFFNTNISTIPQEETNYMNMSGLAPYGGKRNQKQNKKQNKSKKTRKNKKKSV